MQALPQASPAPDASAQAEGTPRLSVSKRWLSPVREAASPRVRGVRVALLLLATNVLGVVDLLLTLQYVTTVGMVEANPVARLVMSLQSVWVVVCFKALCMLVCTWLIACKRTSRTAEIGAWVCMLVLLALMARWVWFIGAHAALMQEVGIAGLEMDPNYIRFGGD